MSVMPINHFIHKEFNSKSKNNLSDPEANATHFQRLLNDSNEKEKNETLEKGVQDGHLTLEEALYHWSMGNGTLVTVDASRLTVHQVSDFNEDNWAKGVVQGLGDFAVHGRVSLTKTEDGIKIKSELYDFDERKDASTIRNLETKLGREFAGEGTPYTINFDGSPSIIRNGYTYGQ